MQLTGADILIRTLIEQGCDTLFGYPGGQILNVYDSLYMHQDEIHHVLTAHEQGAVHAADGYARTTGKVGVVISTSGPGATGKSGFERCIHIRRLDAPGRVRVPGDCQSPRRVL